MIFEFLNRSKFLRKKYQFICIILKFDVQELYVPNEAHRGCSLAPPNETNTSLLFRLQLLGEQDDRTMQKTEKTVFF